MAEQWMTVAEAAASLKVHPRTIERRIAAGKMQTRREDGEGTVQVLIEAPDVVPVQSEALETVKELADRQVDIAAGSASALVRISQDLAGRAERDLAIARQEIVVARQETSIVREEVMSVRRGARFAWASVAGLAAVVVVAVGWCSHTITAANATVRQLDERATDAEVTLVEVKKDYSTERTQLVSERQKLTEQRDTFREKSHEEQTARARAEGELAAYKTELAQTAAMRQPATRPVNVVARIAQALAE